MGKIKAVLILLASSLSALGADKVYWFTPGNDAASFTGFTNVSSSFLALENSAMSYTVISNNTHSDFTMGVFTFDSSLNITSLQTFSSLSVGDTGITTDFSSGDMVGFWVEVNGKTYYSVNALNPASKDVVDWKINRGEMTMGFETDGSSIKNMNDAEIKVLFIAIPPSHTPSGQPLPGVFSTILLASLSASGYWFLKRRRRVLVS